MTDRSDKKKFGLTRFVTWYQVYVHIQAKHLVSTLYYVSKKYSNIVVNKPKNNKAVVDINIVLIPAAQVIRFQWTVV